jgi:hypothetical protein
MIRLRRVFPVIAATLLLACGVTAATSGPAHATSGTQICNAQNTEICLNVREGDHSAGTYVIMYTNGDPNNTFQASLLTGICGGYVQGYNNGACPFADGSGLNDLYNGDAIVQFYDYDTLADNPPLCVADSGVTSGSSQLGGCSWYQTNFGWGGATGSVFILSGVTNFADMGVSPFVAVNFHYTSLGVCGLHKPAFMVGPTSGAGIYLNSCTANNGWFQAP